jgi:plastocyanin
VKVVIDKLVFTPAEISLAVGDTIEWVNRDVMEHTATVEGGFDVRIPAKKSASIVLKEAGTLDYYCRYHPNMRGRIVARAK